jgi:hypothetical protein
MKANENVELLSLSSPSHWKLQNPKCTMLIVSSYNSPSMMKWDFNLVLGLWNQPITNQPITNLRFEGFWKQNNQLRFLTKLSTDFQFISHPTTLLNYLGHFDTCLLNNLFILRISFLINDIFSNIPSESLFSLRKNISEKNYFFDHFNISGK